MSRRASLLLVVVLTVLSLSLIAVMPEPASASIPKPSVPEFTLKFVNASYSVTNTNPYTGVNEIQLINNNSIEITIENQFFDYSNDYRIYFNVRAKPHFEGNWTEIYPIQNMTSSYDGDGAFSYALYINRDSPTQSSSSYTNITFPVVPTEVYQASGYDIRRYYSGTEGQEGTYFAFLYAIPAGGQVDFQVQALVGHNSTYWYIQHPLFPTYGGFFEPAIAFDTTSGWSNTQTVTLDSNSHSPASSSTPLDFQNSAASSDQSGFSWVEAAAFVVLGIVIALLIVIIAHMHRRNWVLEHKVGSLGG